MKKILMGLVALSASSLAFDVSGDGTNETNVWKTGQLGKIVVNGSLTSSAITGAKYVVYTSADGSLTGATDELVLPTFTLSQNPNIPTMKGTAQKVYVKRIVNGQEENLSVETVKFLLSGLDAEYSNLTGRELAKGDITDIPVTAFLAKAEVEKLLNAAFPTEGTVSVSKTGDPEFTPTSGTKETYRVPRKFNFNHKELGVLEMYMSDNNWFTSDDTMSAGNAAKFEAQFATTQTGTFPLRVKISFGEN